MLSVGVLASGAGSNLAALLESMSAGRIEARVAVVITNVPGALAAEKARAAGIPAVCLPHGDYPSREAFEAAIQRELEAHGVELLVLAGFMRILGAAFVRSWHGRLLNVHPSLLPAFPGVASHAQALAAGVRITGCTVHLVDEGTDTGPIVAQAAVPILPDDTAETLHERIQRQEHRLLPWVVGLFARGLVRLEGRKVHLDLPVTDQPPLIVPPLEASP